jgi:hypothetical protein
MRQRRAAAQVGTVERGRHNLAPLCVLEAGEIDLSASACVVDENVKPAELANRCGDECRGRGGIADIGDVRRRAATGPSDFFRHRFRVGGGATAVHDDGRSTRGKRERNRPTDVARAAGDQGDAAGKLVGTQGVVHVPVFSAQTEACALRIRQFVAFSGVAHRLQPARYLIIVCVSASLCLCGPVARGP